MAKTKRIRWECPNGRHPAVLGPSVPRKNNIVRYCLKCSETEGVLVERVAPTLVKKREAGAARSSAKAEAKRRKERDKKFLKLTDAAGRTVEFNPESELARIVRAGEREFERGFSVPVLDWRRGTSGHTSGRAWTYRITATFGAQAEGAWATLVHEAAHSLTAQLGYQKEHHGDRWRSTYRVLVRALVKDIPVGAFRGQHENYCYAIDRTIIEALREMGKESETPIIGKLVAAE